MTKQYVIHPGWVYRNGMRFRWVSYDSLINLYRLDKAQCEESTSLNCFVVGTDEDGKIHLYPDDSGKYEI